MARRDARRPTLGADAAHIPRDHRIRVAGRATRITGVVVNPGRLATPPAPIDLALVQLDPPAAGVPILALFEGDDEAGRELLLVGRGDFGNGRDGVLGTDHRRCAASPTGSTASTSPGCGSGSTRHQAAPR